MNCKRSRSIILTDHIDGSLKAGELLELNKHIKECPECRLLEKEAKKTSAIFANPVRQDPPQKVWQNIRSEIDRKSSIRGFIREALESMRFVLPNLRPVAVAIGAAVILIVLAATLRSVSVGYYEEMLRSRDDIINMVSLNGDTGSAGSEPEYDLGTPAEAYFL